MVEPLDPSSFRPRRPNLQLLAVDASFLFRSKGLQLRRLLVDLLTGPPRLAKATKTDFPFVIGESISPLHTVASASERPLALGKIHNLRLACRRLDGLVLDGGQTFSFWRHVGPPWRSRGYVKGREVREGCVIPTTGGGLCQLSGSLLELATGAGLDILEHHRHTVLPADVPHNPERDATLFWNYVDLRFRASVPLLIESRLTQDSLIVRLRGRSRSQSASVRSRSAPNRIDRTTPQRSFAAPRTAYLLDEYRPELGTHLRANARSEDQVLMPFRTRGADNWDTGLAALVEAFPLFRVRRSLALRYAAARGKTVAKAHFRMAEALAALYGHHLAYDTEHLCVAQSLLPYLWRAGLLGGRTFDVLMYRLPAAVLELELDLANRIYPASRTLREFRAPRWFVEAEANALRAARQVVTPHAQIAELFDNVVRLPWEVPVHRGDTGAAAARDTVVFLGPTLARKGAYAVREMVRRTGLELTVVGPDLEAADFWDGLPIRRQAPTAVAWDRVHTVLQPALFEYWPRQLLHAHAAGANLVVSPGCGLDAARGAGVYHVPFGDAEALTTAVLGLVGSARPDGSGN